MDFVTLMGAEDVREAGSAMRSSAEVIRQAAGSMEDSLHRHRLFLDDWLFRLEELMKINKLIESTEEKENENNY